MTVTNLTMANGRNIDLLNPCASDIDFEVIAEHLAKTNRFNGATRDEVYSVAEHCVRGAQAIIADTGDHLLAAYFLLHDAHEAFVGDITRPMQRALVGIAEEWSFGWVCARALERLVEGFDRAIHKAAGLSLPTIKCLAKIRHYDMRMFATEWRDLMGSAPLMRPAETEDFPLLNTRIVPAAHWMDAREAYATQCRMLLPALKAKATD